MLDQAPVFQKLSFKHTMDACRPGLGGSNPNNILRGFTMPVYKCPSSAASINGRNTSPSPTNNNRDNTMLIDYVGMAGAAPLSGFQSAGSCSGQTGYGGIYCNNGLLAPNEAFSMRDATDGTSNSILVAEQSGKIAGLYDIRSNYYGGWNGHTDSRKPPAMTGSPWGSGTSTIRYTINHTSRPGGANSTWDANTILNSYHVGGIHVLLGDGAVRFISQNINQLTLHQLGSKQDGQVLGQF